LTGSTSYWGEATAFLNRFRRTGWIDLLILAGLGGAFLGIISLASDWTGPSRPAVDIDLSLSALPLYTFYSLCRGLLAYVLSLIFTIVYGYWAAKDQVAEKVLVPLLDILQSIPVLGFMPGVVLALVAVFPRSNIGLELASVIMIFTGQAWNMTFSFYHSLRSIPGDQREAATVYRFTWWERLKTVELPFSAIGLVWNSMMSMAGGWFFLMITETFVLGSKDFRLRGIGSYMSVAVAKGNVPAMLWAIVAMVLMIVLLDQLLWRPVVTWAEKFRVEESSGQEAATSWFLDLLHQSRMIAGVKILVDKLRNALAREKASPHHAPVAAEKSPRWAGALSLAVFAVLLGSCALGAWELFRILRRLTLKDWLPIVDSDLWTLGRVLISTAVGTIWAVPAGLAIGLSPKLSRILQPVAQVAASFPAPMLFPLVIAGLHAAGIGLGWGSVVLMLLGTQWYILFNVIAGATSVPGDLREVSTSYRLSRMARFRTLYLPALFPYLVTGWVTAAGGAWNASIVAEYVSYKGQTLTANGLGARISEAAEHGDFARLAASVVIMALTVVVFNRVVWKRCYALAEERFSLSK
jgi:NitT/TauT family transport system permease protein